MDRKGHHSNNLGSIIENFIIAAIVLVLIVTLLDEFAIINSWSIQSRNKLMIAGFIFDVIFTIEFIARIIITSRAGEAKHYIVHERGWVDFLSSVPLLLLNSGPEMLLYLFPDMMHNAGGDLAFFGALKVVKAIRVTRILRLLRMVKILGKIQNTESTMANRHLSVISTTIVIAIIVTFGVTMTFGVGNLHSLEDQKIESYKNQIKNMLKDDKIGERLQKAADSDVKDIFNIIFFNPDAEEPELMHVYRNKKLILSNYTNEELKNYYYYDETRISIPAKYHDPHLHYEKLGEYEFVINLIAIHKEKSKIHLLIFFTILASILSLLFVYSRHFVQNVTDIIHVMKLGFKDEKYMLEARIKPEFDDDEIFELAEEYNIKFLPEKARKRHEKSDHDTGGLTLDDFMNQ